MAKMSKQALQDYVKALASHLESRYGERNNYLEQLREQRFMRCKVNIPDVYRKTATQYKSATIFDTIRKSVAMIGTQMPQPKVVPLKPGDDSSQRNSSLKEAWHRAAFIQMDKGKHVYARAIDALIGDCGTVYQCGLDQHKWGGVVEGEGPDASWKHIARAEDEKWNEYLDKVESHHKKNFPFWWQAIPLESFYPVYDADGQLTECVIRGKRSAYPLMGKYPRSQWTQQRKLGRPTTELDADSVEFTEYWNSQVYMRLIETEVVEYETHPYKRPPFWPVRGVVTSSTDPVDEVMGIAAPLVDVQTLLNSLMTMKLNYAYLTMFVTYALVPVNSDFQGGTPEAEQNRTVTIKIGEVYTPPPGYKLEPIAMPPSGQDANQTLQYLEAKSKELGLATVLNGEMPSGDVSGPALITQINLAKSIFGTPVSELCRAFSEIAAWQEEMIETVLKEPVPVWAPKVGDQPKAWPDGWLALGPKDIKGYYEVEHSMKHVLPAERIQWSAFLTQLRNMGITIPNLKVLEDGVGISNPETWVDEFTIEKLLQDPDIQQRIKDRAKQLLDAKQRGAGTPPAAAAGLSGGMLSPTPMQQPQQQIAAPEAPPSPNGGGMGQGMMP